MHILSQSPTDVGVIREYAQLLVEVGDTTEAELLLRKSLSFDEDNVFRNYLAVDCWEQRRSEEARKLLEDGDKTSYGSTMWMNLAIARAEAKRFGLAIEALTQAIKGRSTNLFIQYALAELYAMMGDVDACVAKLRWLSTRRFHRLPRINDELAFDSIRTSEPFVAFMKELHANGLA
ncbi:MAG: hypothetical protein HY248_05250 [Fimbriimonas ginsengisoli]|nr:hypothetical protein [Fimbriimonas ginsengisoli]